MWSSAKNFRPLNLLLCGRSALLRERTKPSVSLRTTYKAPTKVHSFLMVLKAHSSGTASLGTTVAKSMQRCIIDFRARNAGSVRPSHASAVPSRTVFYRRFHPDALCPYPTLSVHRSIRAARWRQPTDNVDTTASASEGADKPSAQAKSSGPHKAKRPR